MAKEKGPNTYGVSRKRRQHFALDQKRLAEAVADSADAITPRPKKEAAGKKGLRVVRAKPS